jgi:hypothetical protein
MDRGLRVRSMTELRFCYNEGNNMVHGEIGHSNCLNDGRGGSFVGRWLLQTYINFPRFLPIFPDLLERLSHLAPIY